MSVLENYIPRNVNKQTILTFILIIIASSSWGGRWVVFSLDYFEQNNLFLAISSCFIAGLLPACLLAWFDDMENHKYFVLMHISLIILSILAIGFNFIWSW